MAFGVKREELLKWKREVEAGQISFLTHYWLHPRVPGIKTVTKVGCADLKKLTAWADKHQIDRRSFHFHGDYPHIDLIGSQQKEVLAREGQWEQIQRFQL